MLAVAPKLDWSPEVLPLAFGALVLFIYGRRWARVRRSASPRSEHDAPIWRLLVFCLGVAVAELAVISPIDSLSQQLFAAHMVQHIMLLDVSPILAILGFTKVILRPITRTVNTVERRAGFFAGPVFAASAYIAVIWLWHIPAAYDYAVVHPPIHVLEHLSFMVVGSLYWWHVLSPIRARRRLTGLGPMAYMGSTKIALGVLGMGLAFAPVAIYSYYVHQPRVWGISPLTDQSLAGIIMAVEQTIVMGVALVWLFIKALEESERDQQRRERLEAASS
jgi:cytochrome c oxidase assembly factor CtaG